MYGRRSAIWIRTIFVTVLYAAAIHFAYRELTPRFENRALVLAVAFTIVQSTAIVLMLAGLLTRRGVAERRARRSATIAQDVHDAIAQHAAGVDRLRVLRAFPRREVSRALKAFLGTTRGSMHSRVTALAHDLGVAPASETLLDDAVAANAFDRALLAARLQPNAEDLAAGEIPRALAIGEERAAIAALDLLRTWRRSLPVQGLEHALTHPSAEVRRRAFAVIPYVRRSHESLVPDGLRDGSPHVRIAAAQAAAKLRLFDRALEDALHDSDRDVAIAAAFALAMTPEGLATLQRHASEPTAFEALEKATMGRLELA